MKTNISKIKNISIGIILGIGLTLSLGVFAATNGTLGELFIQIGTEYRLIGDNIQDNTVDSSEIEENSIQAIDLAANSVGTSELADNSVGSVDILNNTITELDISDSFKARDSDKLDNIDSIQFLRSDQNDTMNGNLTINGSTIGLISYGTSYGGYFKDSNSSGHALLGYSDYGIAGYGDLTGGYFKDTTSSIYGRVGYGAYTIYGNGKIAVTGDIYTGGKKVATEDYVDNKVNNSTSIIGATTKYGPYGYTDSSAKNLGSHIYCSINRMGNAEDGHYCDVYKSGSTWYMKQYKTGCIAYCLD